MDAGQGRLRRPRSDGTPVRLLFAFLGIALWLLVQARLHGLFAFLGGGIASQAAGAILSTAILWPFWKRFRTPGTLLGLRLHAVDWLAAAVLLAPFAGIALSTGPVWVAPRLSEWTGTAGALLLLAAAEEIVCRGFLLDLLSPGGRRYVGVTLSSAAFAALHLSNDGVCAVGLGNIFLAGVLFGLLRLSTGGLAWPVAVHWIWNLFTGMVFGWSVSGHPPMPTLFTCTGSPPWGAFGPEESILMTIGLLLGVGLETVQLRTSS